MEIMDFIPINIYALLDIHSLYSIYHLTFSQNYSYPGERHNFWELSYIIQGNATISSENNIYNCHTGDMVLQAPNQFHRIWLDGKDSCESFTISFDGRGLTNHLYSGKYLPTEQEQRIIFHIMDELPPIFGGYDTTEFTRLFTTASPNDIGYQIIKNYLELLCLSLIRRGNEARGYPIKDDRTMCYAKTMVFLQNNVEKNLKMEDICQGIYESPGKIKDIFHQFTGGGVMRYFYRLRCEHIMRLLSEGHSIKEIASIMDFSSPYYLSYFFKRETGMTAREYLKKNVKSDDEQDRQTTDPMEVQL